MNFNLANLKQNSKFSSKYIIQFIYSNVFQSLNFIFHDKKDLTEKESFDFGMTGSIYSVTFAINYKDASYYDMSFMFLMEARSRCQNAEYISFIHSNPLQTLAIAVKKAFRKGELSGSDFNSLSNMNSLMKLAGMTKDSEFELDCIKDRLQELIPSMDFVGGTATADQVLEEFNLIAKDEDSPSYLSTRLAVYGYCMHQYSMIATDIAAREARKRLEFIEAHLKTKELFKVYMSDSLKLQRIGDPNDKMIPKKAVLKYNVDIILENIKKLYEVFLFTSRN